MEKVVQIPGLLERLATKINAEHDAFRSGISDSVKHAIAAGELLIEAKGKVQHGEWLPWLAANCSFAQPTASLYVRAANKKAEIERQITNGVINLSLREVIALLKKIGADEQDDGLPSEPAKQNRETRKHKRSVLDRAREIVRPLVDNNAPINNTELERKHGISERTFRAALEGEEARAEALKIADEDRLIEMARASLPKTSQGKLDIVLRRELKRMEQEFEERVRQRSQENDEKLWKPYYDEKLKFAEAVVAGRNGVFTKAEYNEILFCLSPDHVASLGEYWFGRHSTALRLFRAAEIKLVDEQESPQMGARPWTLEELDQRKAAVKAERAARRAGKA